MTTIQTTATPGNRRFYGWYALAGVMLTTMASIGAVVVSFGVFLPEVSADFGWSRAAVATGLTLGLLCNGLLGPLWGSIVTKFGPRASLITGGLFGTEHIGIAVVLMGVMLGFLGVAMLIVNAVSNDGDPPLPG